MSADDKLQNTKKTPGKRLRIGQSRIAVTQVTDAADSLNEPHLWPELSTETTDVIVDGSICRNLVDGRELLRKLISGYAFSAATEPE